MSIKKACYEECLAEYSDRLAAIALLKQHRPYLEMLPSLRRPYESVIPIPLPIIRLRNSTSTSKERQAIKVTETTLLPCDIAFLMCDPEWKIKTGVEIFLFIYRPNEDFSDFLGRWRQTQVLLNKEYEWIMPLPNQHIFSEGANSIYPLFIIFPETPERIKRGLQGASLPFIDRIPTSVEDLEEAFPDNPAR
ncbi:hypothetical protein [Chroococcidiopsis thermalis]|uniref:Type IV pilin PilA n=1 Tax=Chroococcidiopsis thermalis (strain PCC 7203) TaxID=251229 RepID=K9TYI7_CHRTP|nr:hypothetical protein [Chroococcidiopsis thermalis]AFY87236.1 hypothetical protein Chro_1719 [Chroococcidiopsis thermalis PCC 7203]